LSGFTKPLEAIQATRPMVIIDEPHRFPREGAYYKAVESVSPQMIIRLGATFPDFETGIGKHNKKFKDYYRKQPQYCLHVICSFNNGLVKGIDVYYPNVSEKEAKNQWTVDYVTSQKLILKNEGKKYTFGKEDNISFEGDIIFEGGTDKNLS